MDLTYSRNCEVLRARFEGREAIYVEKDALRVRVTNIRFLGQSVGADVEEIMTRPGEEASRCRRHPSHTRSHGTRGFITPASSAYLSLWHGPTTAMELAGPHRRAEASRKNK